MIQMHNKLLGGILLVSGTTIGAGMLALPVITGFAGFFPSLVLLVVYWGFMTFTAFLMMEVNLWMEPNTNLITMAKKTLGRPGEVVSWIAYLFLLYALTTAYIAGSAPIVVDFVASISNYHMPLWAGSLPLLLLVGYFVYRGTKSVDYINRFLMIGLVISYGIMIVVLTPHVEAKRLSYANWPALFLAVSIVATSFGFHIVIPSLTTYMERDVPKLKKAIWIGSLIPLLVYISWELLTLGIIPLEGRYGISQGYREGSNGAHLLSGILGHTAIAAIARFFSFFAIVTSFLGVSLSLLDFLADGFKIEKSAKGKLWLCLLTFLPPLVITLIDPRAFLSALEYAGAFGVMVLLGLIPALMVWWGRYKRHYQGSYRAAGGKVGLVIAMAFSLFVIGVEIGNKL